MLLWVERSGNQPLKAEFYALSGRLLKTAQYLNYAKLDNTVRPTQLVMEDAVKRGDRSVLDYSAMKPRELPNKLFNKDYMKRVTQGIEGLIPPWYLGDRPGEPPSRDLAQLRDDLRAGSYGLRLGASDEIEPRPVDVDALVVTLAEHELDSAAMVGLYILAERAIDDAIAHPTLLPPPATVRLLHELVLQPEPDRFRLRDCVSELFPSPSLRGPREETMAYCEFNIVGVGSVSAGEIVRRFALVKNAIRRAECWLGAADVNHERLGDAFSVIVRDGITEASWPGVLRFTREVYQTCFDAGVQLRCAACIGPSLVFEEVHGRAGAAGVAQKSAHLVLEQSPYFRDKAQPRHGVAAAFFPRKGESAEQSERRIADYWREAGGEPMVGSPIETIAIGGGEVVHYQIRRAGEERLEFEPSGATRVGARREDDPPSS